MQRSKFCSVGAISKIFERDFLIFYGVISIIICASVTNLVLNQYKFGFEAQPIAYNDMLWNFLGMTLAGLCFSLSYGCPGKHLVQMGAGITPFAPYATETLTSTLSALVFYQKGVIKFGCFCRFLLINFEVKFLEKFSHQRWLNLKLS